MQEETSDFWRKLHENVYTKNQLIFMQKECPAAGMILKKYYCPGREKENEDAWKSGDFEIGWSGFDLSAGWLAILIGRSNKNRQWRRAWIKTGPWTDQNLGQNSLDTSGQDLKWEWNWKVKSNNSSCLQNNLHSRWICREEKCKKNTSHLAGY